MKPHSELPDSALHVLLVDDSLEELRLLSGMLRAEHFRLTVADDGRKGYQRAVVSQPDLILMDVAMPQLDGFSACRLLKADPATRHIPVIFLTAKNAPEERLLGLRLGGVDYVSKPVLAEEVVARIRIHLNRVRNGNVTHTLDGSRPQRQPDEVIFRAAADLIQDRLENLPPLPEIARMVGTHEKKLGQIFRERLGLTVSAFAAEERIVVARRLLAETDMNIQTIAEQVGFGSAGNFTTAFRKRMGMTPSLYRQALQEQEDEFP
jgi:CheY-like chemotaxis protein